MNSEASKDKRTITLLKTLVIILLCLIVVNLALNNYFRLEDRKHYDEMKKLDSARAESISIAAFEHCGSELSVCERLFPEGARKFKEVGIVKKNVQEPPKP